ncbi:uncharacterized protein [Paramisgurnus dabryanus]|uniref:uncharacterized protein isoform X1 n=1 Tax=Paramisgurnus dabryanus TaxID=90735 RepID=UPI003CCFAF71
MLLMVVLSSCFCCLVDVFGDEVKSVMEGDSLTLHNNITELQRDDVIEWRFGDKGSLIARINKTSNIVRINADVLDGRFRDRLQLNNQTGELIITNITTQHAGLYQVINRNTPNTPYRFNVTVYGHLPIPVITTQNSSSSETSSCVLLCSVLNVRDVSLSWYKGNCLLSSISVSDLNISSISLPLKCLDDSYSCVVNNTISNQTQHLNITDVCQTSSDCVCCCYISEAVIRLVLVGLVVVATVAVLVYDIRSRRAELKEEVQTSPLD